MKKRKGIILLVLAFLWTVFIWSNSARTAPASDQQSGVVVNSVKNVLNKTDIAYRNGMLTQDVRKTAHVIEYVLQAALLCGMFLSFGLSLRRAVLPVSFCGLMTAVMDEFIQLYSAGRGSSVADVLLDFCGVLLGFGLFCLARSISRIPKASKQT